MNPTRVCVCTYNAFFRLATKSGSFQDIADKRAICLIRQRTHTHMHIHTYICICIS